PGTSWPAGSGPGPEARRPRAPGGPPRRRQPARRRDGRTRLQHRAPPGGAAGIGVSWLSRRDGGRERGSEVDIRRELESVPARIIQPVERALDSGRMPVSRGSTEKTRRPARRASRRGSSRQRGLPPPGKTKLSTLVSPLGMMVNRTPAKGEIPEG